MLSDSEIQRIKEDFLTLRNGQIELYWTTHTKEPDLNGVYPADDVVSNYNEAISCVISDIGSDSIRWLAIGGVKVGDKLVRIAPNFDLSSKPNLTIKYQGIEYIINFGVASPSELGTTDLGGEFMCQTFIMARKQ